MKIFELYFQGYPRDEIAKILMIGEGTVTERLKILPSSVQFLRDLGKAMRRLDLVPQEALKGVNLLELLAKYGIAVEELPTSLEAIRKVSVQAGYEPQKLVQATIKLADLENQAGAPYPEALKKFETLTQHITEAENEHSQLLLEIQESKRLRNAALKQAKTTSQELSEFLDCKAALHEYGMEIRDAVTLRRGLDNIREAGGNAKRLVSLIKKHRSIAKLVAYFERQLPKKQDEFANLCSRIKECQQTILQLREEENKLTIIINSQKDAINGNNYQLSLVLANIAELEKRRQALITWIGKQLNLPREEIDNLRLNSQYGIMLAVLDNALRDAQARVLRSLR